MKKILIILIGVISVLLVASCSSEKEPKIRIHLKVSELSDKEYSNVETNELSDPKQVDFKKIEYTLHMENTKGLKNLNIQTFKNWKQVLGSIDGNERYWYGNGKEQENSSENFVEYESNIIFYAKGLSKKELKAKLSEEKVIVSWTDKDKKQIKKQYNLGEIMEWYNK